MQDSALPYIQLVLMFILSLCATRLIQLDDYRLASLLILGFALVHVWRAIYLTIKALCAKTETRKSRFQVLLKVIAMFILASLVFNIVGAVF